MRWLMFMVIIYFSVKKHTILYKSFSDDFKKHNIMRKLQFYFVSGAHS